jgi:hypothetical protein
MIVMVVHAHAHRLLKSGILQSAPTMGNLHIDNELWQQRDPSTMGLTGGEYDFIRSQLDYFRSVFPNEDMSVPYSEPVVPVEAQDPMRSS